MNLLVERGLLLKPYTRPFDTETGQHLPAPPGWTPDRDEWVEHKATELQEKAIAAGVPVGREAALQAAEKLAGERLIEARLPWPGWVPAKHDEDEKLTRAYAKLAQKLDQWPPDGRYVWRGGEVAERGNR